MRTYPSPGALFGLITIWGVLLRAVARGGCRSAGVAGLRGCAELRTVLRSGSGVGAPLETPVARQCTRFGGLHPGRGRRGASGAAPVHPARGFAPGTGAQRASGAAPVHPAWGFAPGTGAQSASGAAPVHPVRGFAPGTGALVPDPAASAPAAGANPRTGCSSDPHTGHPAPAAGANPRTGCRHPPAQRVEAAHVAGSAGHREATGTPAARSLHPQAPAPTALPIATRPFRCDAARRTCDPGDIEASESR